VQTVELANAVEARRCRFAQYRGVPAEVRLNGSKFFGMVRSIMEDPSTSPPRWIVTVVSMAEKPLFVGWRYSKRP